MTNKSPPNIDASSNLDSPLSNSGLTSSTFNWTISSELALFQTLATYKPAGINKHFNMALAVDRLSTTLGDQITSEDIWIKLRSMFDLAAVDDREEVIPFPLEEKEFSLPRRDFGSLVSDKQKEILRDRAMGRIGGKVGGIIRVGLDMGCEAKRSSGVNQKETIEKTGTRTDVSDDGRTGGGISTTTLGSKRHTTRSSPSGGGGGSTPKRRK